MANGIDASVVLDGVVVMLLVATIAYAVILNRRIGEMRKWKAEFDRLITAFNQAATRAEAGIQLLKSVADQRGPALQHNLDKARALRDDLAYLVDRGDAVADRLADTVRSSVQSAPGDAAAGQPVEAPGSIADAGAVTNPARAPRAADNARSAARSGVKQGARRTKTARALLKALEGMR